MRTINSTGSTVSEESIGVSRRRAWAVTAMVVALMMINFGDKAVLGLAAGPIMRDLDLSATQFGAVSSSFYLLFSLSAIVVGFVSNRVSTTKILGVIAVLWSISALPVIFLATVPMLYLSRIALGAAEGPTSPIAVHAVQKWFPERNRTLPTALTQVGGGLGIAITAPTLTFLIVSYGWRAAFIALTAVGLLWAFVWAFVGKEGPLSSYDAARSGVVAMTAVEPSVTYRNLFLNRTWLGGVIAGIGAYWALAMSTAWLPTLLENGLGFSAKSTSYLVALPPILSVVAMLTVPWAADRWISAGVSIRIGRGAVSGAVVVLAGACMLLVPLTTGVPAMLLICVAVGIPSAIYPMFYLMIAHISPVRRRGSVISTGVAIITLTGVAAPLIIGRIMDAAGSPEAGFGRAFTVSAVILIVTGLLGALAMHPDADARRLGLRG